MFSQPRSTFWGRLSDYQRDEILIQIVEQLDDMHRRLYKLETEARRPTNTSSNKKSVESSQPNKGKLQEKTSILAVTRSVQDKVEVHGGDENKGEIGFELRNSLTSTRPNELPNLVVCLVSPEEITESEQIIDTSIEKDVKEAEEVKEVVREENLKEGAEDTIKSERLISTLAGHPISYSTIDFVVLYKFYESSVDTTRSILQWIPQLKRRKKYQNYERGPTKTWMHAGWILIIQHFKTRGRVFSNRGRMMQTTKRQWEINKYMKLKGLSTQKTANTYLIKK